MIVSRAPLAITFGNTNIDALFSVVTADIAGWAITPNPTSAASPVSPTSPRCLRITLLLSITPHRIRHSESLDPSVGLISVGCEVVKSKGPFFATLHLRERKSSRLAGGCRRNGG